MLALLPLSLVASIPRAGCSEVDGVRTDGEAVALGGMLGVAKVIVENPEVALAMAEKAFCSFLLLPPHCSFRE